MKRFTRVLKVKPRDILSAQSAPQKKKDVLFLEVDGLHVHKQQSARKNREIKIGIVHEGWRKRHPSSRNYELKNKS